ncbi:MAG: tRNA pseudouridine(54/55) synthase Pus10 [Candidatus Anstonellaceae archaeon]
MKFPLCKICKECFARLPFVHCAPEPADCFVCRGSFSEIPQMVLQAISSSKEFDWESFSVSSSVPKSFLIAEQKIWDFCQPGQFSSIKNIINAKLIQLIRQHTSKQHQPRFPDAVFEFNFQTKEAKASPSNLYIFGHYLKLSRNFCQSKWHCGACKGKGCNKCSWVGKNYPSIEEELGKPFIQGLQAQDCILHASGREDVDVRCMGNGRPFVLEVVAPKKRNISSITLPPESPIKAVGLRQVKKNFVDLVCNSHFTKEYVAVIAADRPLGLKDAKAAESLSGVLLSQQTPLRVLSRRSDLERKRRVFSVSATCLPEGKLKLHIVAEAGTYIKEFISSDEGRTQPSVSSALGCRAVCEELDLVAVHDYFLETVDI